MKTLVVALVGMVFLAGTSSLVVAQAEAEKSAQATKKAAVRTARGVVKAVGADRIVVAGKEKGTGAVWTIGIDAKTKIRKGGKDITPADINPLTEVTGRSLQAPRAQLADDPVGDWVTVRYTQDMGKAVAQSITVSVPRPARKDGADAPKK